MIDFIKAIVKINPDELLNNKLLDFFYRDFNPDTGELKTKNRNNKKRTPHRYAIYLGLEFRIYDTGSVYLIGSLHKFWNNGAHNYNDFNVNALYYVLNELKTKFNITPHQLVLQQLEIGVNITPPYKSGRIIDYCFIHRSKPFREISTRDEGKYHQVEHSQYLIKIYDKRKHYSGKGFKIDNEILRIEIKYLKMEKLNKQNIFTLNDLLQYGLNKFIPELVNEWQRVLFYDFTINSERKPIQNYKNPLYWKEMIDNKRNSALNKHRRKLKDITLNHSENIQEKISVLIEKKANELMAGGAKFDTLYIQSIPAPPSLEKVCKVTGLNISMQKEKSKLLSHTGLKYYLNTNPKIYNSVKRKYLTLKWHKTDLKTEIKEIAHNIRNTENSQRLKQKRIYPANQYRLFSLQ
jgi:hypothetical protein